MVRHVAGWDAARTEQVLYWPIRETLYAYLELLKRDALDKYEHDLLVWATLAPHQEHPPAPPKPPRILRG